MQIPKELPIWEYAPDRHLAEITIRLKNVKGALAQVSVLAAHLNVKVLGGFTSAPSNATIGVWSFFADITDSPDIAKIRRAIMELPVVEAVEVVEADDGFMVDRQNFPLKFSSRRALVMRTDALNGMFQRLWDVFGSGAVAIVDQMAEAMGKYSAQEVLDDLGREMVVGSFDEVLGMYTALGFAQVEVVSKEKDSLVIQAKSNFECQSNAKNSVRRKSTFFRGHLRGFISTVFDSDYEVTESACVAQGDDTCSFSLTRAPRIASRVPVKQALKQGQSSF